MAITQTGILRKMKSHLAEPVQYSLRVNDQEILLNDYLGKPITLQFTGSLFCIQCERKMSKSFQQGFCFPCYRRLLDCNLCVIHPERCRVEEGTCPTDDWAHAQCHAGHVVYLANASGLKIGITRETQVPTRWIDQGALQALPIIKVNNRYRAGKIEVAFKDFVKDKTNWRTMLKNEAPLLDLVAEKKRLLQLVDSALITLQQEFSCGVELLCEKPLTICYPVQQYPTKITSLSLDKTPLIQATLLGIKGQYLLLDSGVINLRKFGGYELTVSL